MQKPIRVEDSRPRRQPSASGHRPFVAIDKIIARAGSAPVNTDFLGDSLFSEEKERKHRTNGAARHGGKRQLF